MCAIVFYQLNWAIHALRNAQEQIQNDVIVNVKTMFYRLEKEVFAFEKSTDLSSYKKETFEQALNEHVADWFLRARNRQLVKELYCYDSVKNELFVWKKNVFEPCSLANKKNVFTADSSLFLLDNKTVLSRTLLDGPDANDKERFWLFAVIDARTFFEHLLPYYTAASFINTDYHFRIRNSASDKTLYSSVPKGMYISFAKPDMHLSLGLISHNQVENIFRPRCLPCMFAELFSRQRPHNDEIFLRPPAYPTVYNELIIELVIKNDAFILQRIKNIKNIFFVNCGALFVLSLGIALLVINALKTLRLASRQQEFVATVTHELKTPIAVISAAGQNLSAGIVSTKEKMQQYGDMIATECNRLRDDIDTYLTYARLANEARFVQTENDLVKLIQDVLQRRTSLLVAKHFIIEVDFPSKSIIVKGDATCLKSIVDNLVSNVLKHAESGRFIRIAVELEKEKSFLQKMFCKITKKSMPFVLMRVQDHGTGIPKKERHLIFEPFCRGTSAHNKQIEGSGVGLNLVKRLAKVHGGSIAIENSTVYGTTFVVRLPVYKIQAISAQNASTVAFFDSNNATIEKEYFDE